MHIDAYYELLKGLNIVLFICILIFVSLPIDILRVDRSMIVACPGHIHLWLFFVFLT